MLSRCHSSFGLALRTLLYHWREKSRGHRWCFHIFELSFVSTAIAEIRFPPRCLWRDRDPLCRVNLSSRTNGYELWVLSRDGKAQLVLLNRGAHSLILLYSYQLHRVRILCFHQRLYEIVSSPLSLLLPAQLRSGDGGTCTGSHFID